MVALGTSFTTAVRVIDRVHRHATDAGASSLPTRTTGLADRHVLVIDIANLTDGGATGQLHRTQLPGGQLEQRVVPFLRHQLDRGAGPPSELAALARLQF